MPEQVMGMRGIPSTPSACAGTVRNKVWPLEIKFGNQSAVSQSMGREGDSRTWRTWSPRDPTPRIEGSVCEISWLSDDGRVLVVSTLLQWPPEKGLGLVTEEKLIFKNSIEANVP